MFFSVKTESTKTVGTIYIRSNGSIDPPDAPISTIDKITYTLTDNITSRANGIDVERSNVIIDGMGYTLQGSEGGRGMSTSRHNITIKNLTIESFDYGIRLFGIHNTISENTIVNNRDGVWIFYTDNTFSGNKIADNKRAVVLSAGSSNFNTFIGNSITGNEWGFVLSGSYGASHNTFYGNNITDNEVGILIAESASCNYISGNNIANNFRGILISGYDCRANDISGNNISLNKYVGIWIKNSSHNNIYHNNFIGNKHHYIYTESSLNSWDDGYPSGGNYWSEYNGTDLYSGPYQNHSGCDGIGDTQYVIEEGNHDNYPLMEPWDSHMHACPIGDINHDMQVDIFDIILAVATYGSTPEDPNWKANVDLAPQYGIIDIFDIVTLGYYYGEKYAS